MDFMKLSHEIENQVYVVSAIGDLREETATTFKNYTFPLTKEEQINGLVIDFKEVFKIDSTGVGIIVMLFKTLQKSQIPLVLCNLSRKINEQFHTNRLDSLIQICSSREEALSSF